MLEPSSKCLRYGLGPTLGRLEVNQRLSLGCLVFCQDLVSAEVETWSNT